MSETPVMTTPLYLAENKKVIDACLDRFLPAANEYPQALHEAVRYSVMAGGKRLRPILALASYQACGGSDDKIYSAACSLELIHTYSLIHDDLPCMDDDDMRRGKPTLHKKCGEAVALLAGDALHDLAFNLMAQTGSARAVLELADAIGTRGMLAGQMADMDAEGKNLTAEQIHFIHTHKTGKLIRAAVRIGAVLADCNDEQLDAISLYGEKVGLAFQIVDDILDIEGNPDLLGKPTGSDTKNQKATFPKVIGLEQSRQAAGRLIEEAIAVITGAIENPDNFVQLARFIGARQN